MTIDLDKINVTPKQIGIGVGVVLALTFLIGIATVEEEPPVLPPPTTTKQLNSNTVNVANDTKKYIINPNTACNYLSDKGIKSSGYKKYDWGNNYIEYFCVEEPLYMVGKYSAIHYSVEGNANLANKIVLQLVYNISDNEQSVKNKYLNFAQALYYKIFNETMPENMNSTILNNSNSTAKKNNISVSSNYEKYENGRGYQLNLEFLIEN